LEQIRGELLRPRVPVRLPVVDDAHAHPAGMNLLTHYFLLEGFAFAEDSCSAFGFGFGLAAALGRRERVGSCSSSTGGAGGGVSGWRIGSSALRVTVMWQVGLRIRTARPRARARQR